MKLRCFEKKTKEKRLLYKCKQMSKMLSCCHITLTSLSDQTIEVRKFGREAGGVSHSSEEHEAEVVPGPTEMDIALLKEQYHWNKKKQQLQTNILLFKKGNKDINGDSLVNVVPINQEVRNSKSFEKQMAYDFVGDFEDYKTPWHTHLSIHRMANNSSRTSDINTVTATRELSSQTGNRLLNKSASLTCPEPTEEQSADPLKLEKSHGPTMPGSSKRGELTISTQRKFSAPAIMSRQLSLPDNKFSSPSSQMKYYPFPQKKCPKKSEAARKLGLYASY